MQNIWSTHFIFGTTMEETPKYPQEEGMSMCRRAPTFPLGSDRKISVYQAEPSFPSASHAVPQLSSCKPLVLLVLISPRLGSAGTSQRFT